MALIYNKQQCFNKIRDKWFEVYGEYDSFDGNYNLTNFEGSIWIHEVVYKYINYGDTDTTRLSEFFPYNSMYSNIDMGSTVTFNESYRLQSGTVIGSIVYKLTDETVIEEEYYINTDAEYTISFILCGCGENNLICGDCCIDCCEIADSIINYGEKILV